MARLPTYLQIASIGSALCVAMFTPACANKAAPLPPAPPEVGVSTAIEQDVPTYGNWVATLDGYENAQIQPQVSGYLIRQTYREGSAVRKGQVLFEIDPRPFQAVLDQAKGQLAQARGQFEQAQAQLGLAEINVRRDTPLAEAHAIAQSQLDNDLQTRKTQQATVQTAQASIQSAEAAIEQAQLNLGFTHVRSLLDGVAGIATTQIGNLVGPTTVLTTVSTVNPIKAIFPISEQEYLQVASSAPRQDWLRNASTVPLQLVLTTGTVYPERGHIIFADRQVDPQTGTIRVVGAFANPGNVLRPGQFGRVRAKTGVRRNAVLVPQRAVSEMQGHYQVAVVGPENKVHVRDVKIGPVVGEMWVIESGLQAGERVVTEGVSKIGEGASVIPKPDETGKKGA